MSNDMPADDGSVGDDETLLRHFPPVFWILDKLTGTHRLSSQAFSQSTRPPGGMSVNREMPMRDAGLEPTHFLPAPEFGLARLVARDLRAMTLVIRATPITGNPFHAEVWGLRKAIQRRLAETAEIVRQPNLGR
jgi:hypothetical protein